MSDYKNKFFSIMGDSISTFEGCVPIDYPCYYTYQRRNYTGVYSVEETWWDLAINQVGGKLLVNNSWSGSVVCKTPESEIESYACSDARTSLLGSDGITPDHIIVFIGANDRGHGFALDAFEGCYRLMLEKIRANYPFAVIWCCTLFSTSLNCKYNAAIEAIASEKTCRVIKLSQKESGDTVDGLHPNLTGMKKIANDVVSALEMY